MAPFIGSLADTNPANTDGVNLQCSTATPWSVFLFLASNYLAHCATVKMYPGSTPLDTGVATILALFIPSSGIIRALFSIGRYARFRRKRNSLERAAAAGALRMVVRTEEWTPQDGDHISPVLNDEGEIRLANGESLTKCLPDTRNKDKQEGPEIDFASGPLVSSLRIQAVEEDPVVEDSRHSVLASFAYHASVGQNKFHGKAILPRGYSWRDVHAEAKISWAESSRPDGPGRDDEDWVVAPPDISSQYN